jgi:hypothetical protein
MFPSEDSRHRSGRRRFLTQLSAMAGTGLALAEGARAEPPTTESPTTAALPTLQLGSHRLSRLIAGYNPIGGYSYLGHHMDQHMREYYTVERTVEFLQQCERAGINAHQFSPSDKMTEVLRILRERGSKMKLICLHSGRSQIKSIVETTGAIAVSHHGGATDKLFHSGKSSEVHDFVKEAHDRGVLAGVSAHNPACIKRIADEGWEVDFFMTCFYFLTRNSAGEETDKVSPVTLQIGYPFVKDDPTAMTEVVRQVKQPCLGFKILGAGRMCSNQSVVQEAFRFAFERIKPTDGVIVGMYPRFFNEIQANIEYTRRFGGVP